LTYFDGMEDKPKINFQNNRLPKFKKWYMVKILFYVIVLIVLMCFLWYSINKKQQTQSSEEIEGVEITF